MQLSRAEQWVVHHVLLDAIGLADGQPAGQADAAEDVEPSVVAIEKLESGTFEFTTAELTFIRRACGAHARDTDAVADRNLAGAVADRIESHLRDASA